MFRANIRVRHQDDIITLCPGDLIGRAATATLRLGDPQVSEAHALLSLRGARLKLLALRGSVTVDGAPLKEVVLNAGMTLHLSSSASLYVESVQCPTHVMALEGLGDQRIILSGELYSIITTPEPKLSPGYHADAPAYLWSNGEEWHVQQQGEAAVVLKPDHEWTVDGLNLRAIAVQLDKAGIADTKFSGFHAASPLRIVARYDTVHLHREGHQTVSISGIPARMLSELAQINAPVDWRAVGAEIWGGLDHHSMRTRWDRNLGLLRRKLRAGGIRSNLVRSDGTGNIEIVLQPGDVIIDET